MSDPHFLLTGDEPGRPTLVLAHGAGAAMDSAWMEQLAEMLATRGLRVARFEFAYMAGRRTGGPKRPPPKVALLADEYHAALSALSHDGALFIGGKSMGGRVASLIADAQYQGGQIAGLCCLGYPFHPQNKPESLRTEHLEGLKTPTLICQGTRDPLGSHDDVAGYALSPAIQMQWLEDGDHDLKPRKRQTGLTLEDHLSTAADVIHGWICARLTA